MDKNELQGLINQLHLVSGTISNMQERLTALIKNTEVPKVCLDRYGQELRAGDWVVHANGSWTSSYKVLSIDHDMRSVTLEYHSKKYPYKSTDLVKIAKQE